MKQFIIPSYTFTPGASGVGTVDLSGILGFNIKYLAAIINQTRGVVIYATGDPARGYTNLVGTTLTLFFDTSSHNSGDTLQVMYELTDLNPLTNAQLRATAVPISGTVAVSGTVPVSGTVTANTGLTQPLTDAQLRSTALLPFLLGHRLLPSNSHRPRCSEPSTPTREQLLPPLPVWILKTRRWSLAAFRSMGQASLSRLVRLRFRFLAAPRRKPRCLICRLSLARWVRKRWRTLRRS